MVSVLESKSRGLSFEPCAGSLCCVLIQDTLLSQYLSPPRRYNYWVPTNCQGNLKKFWWVVGGLSVKD